MKLLFLTCPPRSAAALVDALAKSLEKANIHAQVLHGMTNKSQEGFVILATAQDFPHGFVQSLHQEQTISDYVICSEDDPSSQQEPGATPQQEREEEAQV